MELGGNPYLLLSLMKPDLKETSAASASLQHWNSAALRII